MEIKACPSIIFPCDTLETAVSGNLRAVKGFQAGTGVCAQQTKGISQCGEEPGTLWAPSWPNTGAVPPDFL